MFFNNQKKIHENIKNYLSEVERNIEMFGEDISYFFEEGVTESFCESVKNAHQSESKADDIRHAIENDMYKNSLLPDSRGDILGLLESIDRIPGICERILQYVEVRKLRFPSEIKTETLLLLNTALIASKELLKSVNILFTNPSVVNEHIDKVDQLESECDRIEKKILTKIFDLPLDPLHKEQLAKLIEDVSLIADTAEDTSNRLLIASIKRVM